MGNRPLADPPTWSLLHHLCEGSNLTVAGKAAVGQILDRLEMRLGRAWPQRLWTARRGLYSELVWFSSNILELHRLLAFAVQLEGVADTASFAPVLRTLRREPVETDWYHTKLLLEVARAARFAGWGTEFEPRIPGSASKGDVLLAVGKGRVELVEATTLYRSREALISERFGEELQMRISAIERRHGVHATLDLIERIDPEGVDDWLEQVERAAEGLGRRGGVQVIGSAAGTVTIQGDSVPLGTETFRGIREERDAIYRLGGTVARKAAQSNGPYPAWLRIDVRNGLFGFTEWSRMQPGERIAHLARALHPFVESHGHLDGLICSSGTLPVWGATDPTLADAWEQTRDGDFVRALVAPHVARETVILKLRKRGSGGAGEWAKAYAGEGSWLDHDLATLGLPSLAAFWPQAVLDSRPP